MRCVGVAVVVVALAVAAAGQQFQDEVKQATSGQPVFQDPIPREGFHEVEPGVYAPKVVAPPKPPRRPYQFDDDAHMKDELRIVYQRMVASEDGLLRYRDFDRLVTAWLNPGDLTVYDRELELLEKRMSVFKYRQGLLPESHHEKLHIGFLNRGSPFRFLKKLAGELRAEREAIRAEYLAQGRKDLVEGVEGKVVDGKPATPPLFEDEVAAPAAATASGGGDAAALTASHQDSADVPPLFEDEWA